VETNRILVVGAGNGGSVAAADLTLNGFEVTLFNRTEARLRPFRSQGGIHLMDPSDRGIIEIACLTTDIETALERAFLVAIMVPTSALGYYARLMAPSLSPDHRVLLAPGHTGGALFFRRAVADLRPDLDLWAGEAHTLPYIARMSGEGQVTVWKRSDRLLFSALPANRTDSMVSDFKRVFPVLRPVSSVLETSLSNFNAVMHPAGMILNTGWIEHTAGDFRYYSEGNTPGIGRVIKATDDERLRIGEAFGIELQSFLDGFYASGYTTEEAWRSGDVYEAIRHSEPNRNIAAPPSLNHRYVHEDIGFGLVPMLALARCAGVVATTMEALVHLASVATGIDQLEKGLNAERLGIEQMTLDDLRFFAFG
jgi:opine dehydrogenase